MNYFLPLFAIIWFSLQLPLLKAQGSPTLTEVGYSGRAQNSATLYIYVPINLVKQPPIVVALHYCAGSAWDYYYGSPYARLADQYGFIVLYPSSPNKGTCWDVSSARSLTRNGGGDSNAIADMVKSTLLKYNGDPSKVFVTGSSSGAMMTNVLAATYPNIFAAATAYSGTPAGCFLSRSNQVNAWNSSCASGEVDASSQYWTKVVNSMDPGYSGTRPRVQIYHGSSDKTLAPSNYWETVKQWTGVFGYNPLIPMQVENNFPRKGYMTSTWGIDAENPEGTVQGIYAKGVGHTVPINGTHDMMWFGLGPYASLYSPTSNASSNTTTPHTPPEPYATASARKRRTAMKMMRKQGVKAY